MSSSHRRSPPWRRRGSSQDPDFNLQLAAKEEEDKQEGKKAFDYVATSPGREAVSSPSAAPAAKRQHIGSAHLLHLLLQWGCGCCVPG